MTPFTDTENKDMVERLSKEPVPSSDIAKIVTKIEAMTQMNAKVVLFDQLKIAAAHSYFPGQLDRVIQEIKAVHKDNFVHLCKASIEGCHPVQAQTLVKELHCDHITKPLAEMSNLWSTEMWFERMSSVKGLAHAIIIRDFDKAAGIITMYYDSRYVEAA
jgi:hypothetical protein